MEKRQVVLLGSGITSLSTAYYLKKSGIEDFTILERLGEHGGLCRSITKNGFCFDYTGHVLWRMDGETRKFYEEVLGSNLVWVDRKAAVFTHGRFVPYPFQAHLKYLPDEVAYECLLGFLNRGQHLRGTDFESWSLSMFGRGIHENFMVPFNEKLFGVPMREMTHTWCSDVPVPTIEQILKGTILGEKMVMKGNAKFGYPKVGGMQALVDELLKRVGKDKIMTGRTVTKVDVEKKIVTHRDWSGNEHEIQYEQLVSTIPFRKLLKITTPQDGKLREYAFQLKSNSVACVMLGFEKKMTDLHWLYVPERDFSFYRIGFPSNLVDSVAPYNCSSVTAEITLREGMDTSYNDLIKSTLTGLRALGLWNETNKVQVEHVELIAPAYVIYNLVREQKVPQLLAGYKQMGVHSVGRYGGWAYSSVSENISEARITARAISGQARQSVC